MARYTGPKTRIARKFGEAIFGPDKVLSKKNYPPGQHGNARKRKTSEYGIQLREGELQPSVRTTDGFGDYLHLSVSELIVPPFVARV